MSASAEALRLKRDRDRLRELTDWLQEEHGPLTKEERAAASEELGALDAEHKRRRARRASEAPGATGGQRRDSNAGEGKEGDR